MPSSSERTNNLLKIYCYKLTLEPLHLTDYFPNSFPIFSAFFYFLTFKYSIYSKNIKTLSIWLSKFNLAHSINPNC